MKQRRFTRLTNGFSRKFANHNAVIGLYVAYYNRVQRHGTNKTTPAVADGVADQAWNTRELIERTGGLPREARRLVVQCPARQLAGFFMRFTIRDVLWLTVVIGLAVGWWIDHGRLSKALAASPRWEQCAGALERLLVDEGYHVVWRWDYADVQIINDATKQIREIEVSDPRIQDLGYNR